MMTGRDRGDTDVTGTVWWKLGRYLGIGSAVAGVVGLLVYPSYTVVLAVTCATLYALALGCTSYAIEASRLTSWWHGTDRDDHLSGVTLPGRLLHQVGWRP